jgi:superfamily II RNA helicase
MNYNNYNITFPFKCDTFQVEAFESIAKRNDCAVFAPTSSGKTLVLEFAIRFMKLQSKRIIYTTPIKALSNEKYKEFREKYESMGITVGLITGDNKINPDADCLIVTAEILRNSLQSCESVSKNSMSKELMDTIGCIGMDEVHYMNDLERGRVWEETIILLPKHIQLVMLSGTVGRPDLFCNWILQCRGNYINTIVREKRPVPLIHSIFVKNKLYQISGETIFDNNAFIEANKEFDILSKDMAKRHSPMNKRCIPEIIKYLNDNDMMQTIIFSFSCKDCKIYADMIRSTFTDIEERNRIGFYFNKYLSTIQMKKYENIAEIEEMKERIMRGIAFHHSGVLQILRELIEILMKEKLIKVLFATETFSMGLNIPTKTVVFTDTHKYTNGGRRPLSIPEYRQMAGRAGRRGLDDYGSVIMLPIKDFPDTIYYQNYLFGENPTIKSTFHISYNSLIKLRMAKIDIKDFYNKSLFKFENIELVKSLKVNIDKYDKLLHDINEKTDNNHELYDKIWKYISFTNNNKNSNVIITMTQKQKQDKRLLQEKITHDKNVQLLYNQLKDKYLYLAKYSEYINEYNFHNNYVQITCEKLDNVMIQCGYITKDTVPTVKGIIMSQINDCNPIILTELIIGNYFEILCVSEIVALLSIFIDPIKKSEILNIHNFDGSDQLHKSITTLEKEINVFVKIEEVHIPASEKMDMMFYVDYIDMAYNWALGTTTHQMLEYFKIWDVNVEAFCKGMNKILNIIDLIKQICIMIHKEEIIQKLDDAIKIVNRDIIVTNSLYLC